MKIELTGIGAVTAALTKVSKNMKSLANKEMAGSALRTVGMAQRRLQTNSFDSAEMAADIGAVRQSINFTHDPANVSATVFAGNVTGEHIAAYLEFGTGKYAASYVPGLPEVFQKMAMTFWVNGKGRLREHPYLIPAYIQEGQRLSQRLKGLKVGW